MELPPKIKLLVTYLKQIVSRSRKESFNDILSKYKDRKPGFIGVKFIAEGLKVKFIIDIGGRFDWKFGYTRLGVDVDTEIFCDTVDTIFCIKNGKQKILDQKTGNLTDAPFDFETAVLRGKISWQGDSSTVTIKRFIELLVDNPNLLERIL